ncbi:hypothetical protein Micbo1qcDRAFT_218570 [Microdochium bolleyi]|uniref:F-box domain-containing protein n=1 Tax=Microdochium bolleyi TaxID=196109 RepID=A0A136IPI0_9PEZI|nr:hypothetical protein Micbo1qcDRAFT_218570 [Microdochium bolleyi]
MLLVRLPPEILTQIFDHIGSPFFHQDLGRLTVCQRWADFALRTYFKHITLSHRTLRSLVASGLTGSPSPLRDWLETLDLGLQEFHSQPPPSHPTSNEAPRGTMANTQMKILKDDLAQLAVVARQSQIMHTLRIRARIYCSAEPPRDCLPLQTMHDFLSAANLSVLVLDLPGLCPNSSEQQSSDQHLCPAIGAVLGTLRTIHLRMRSICPDVLRPQQSNHNLLLRTVVINLSLDADLLGTTSAAHSTRCGSQAGGILQLSADIQRQAEALATRMSSPKIVRILTHSLADFQTLSLDVLTGRTMILDEDMAWDEDGEAIEDISEPESEISSVSSVGA